LLEQIRDMQQHVIEIDGVREQKMLLVERVELATIWPSGWPDAVRMLGADKTFLAQLIA